MSELNELGAALAPLFNQYADKRLKELECGSLTLNKEDYEERKLEATILVKLRNRFNNAQ